MKKHDINKLKEEILSGKRLNDVCKETGYDINVLRRILKKEGLDYRQIVSKRKAERNEVEFEKCLKLARSSGLIPSGSELISIGIPKGRIALHVKKLKDMGFMQKFINGSKIGDDDLLQELYKIYKKINMAPGNRHIIMYSQYSNTSYYNHFGSLTNAVNLMLERYTDQKKKIKFSQ